MGDSPSSNNGNDTVEVSRDDRMSPGRATAQFGSEIGSLAGGYSESQVQNAINENNARNEPYTNQAVANYAPTPISPGQTSNNLAQTFSVGDDSYTPQTTLTNKALGSLPISQTNMMRGKDNTDFNFARSEAAQGLREGAKGIGLPSFIPGSGLINTLTGLPSQMKLDALNRGQVPTYKDGMITGTTGQGFGANQTEGYIGGLANNQPGIIGGLNTNPRVDYGLDETTDDGGNDNNEIIRRRMAGEVIPEEELDPALSDDLAVNYLQDPYYLYSGQGNLYQPYGYAQGTLVDLLRTRNLTQPQQAAPNLGLFGNPGDFS